MQAVVVHRQHAVNSESGAVVRGQLKGPDTVCVELDEQRHKALRNPKHWESLNLVQVLRKGQAPFLLANLALAAFQKRMGLHTGVKPGAELAAAAETAEELDKKLCLVDREIRTTLLRAWRKAGFWKKMTLLATLVGSMFESQKIDEEELAKLRATARELGVAVPRLDRLAEQARGFAEQVRRALTEQGFAWPEVPDDEWSRITSFKSTLRRPLGNWDRKSSLLVKGSRCMSSIR